MHRLLPILTVTLLLTACATTPQLGAGAEVQLDRCGQPVVTTTVRGVPAGPAPWQADVSTTVYRPCSVDPSHQEEAPALPQPTGGP